MDYDQLCEEAGRRCRTMSVSAHDRISGSPQMVRISSRMCGIKVSERSRQIYRTGASLTIERGARRRGLPALDPALRVLAKVSPDAPLLPRQPTSKSLREQKCERNQVTVRPSTTTGGPFSALSGSERS